MSSPKRLAVAQERRAGEHVDLGAGVVDVIFAGDVEAGEGEQIGQRVAEHGAAAMAHMHRAGRIGGHILDVHGVPLADGAPPIRITLLQHHAQHAWPECTGECQVDEAGPGDLDLVDAGIGGEHRHDALGELRAAECRAGLASTMAALVARSPWVGSLGAVSVMPSTLASSGTTPSCLSCWTAAKT